MEPNGTNPEIRRYTQTPFPAYRYLPFQSGMPHPRSDPHGHSYGKEDDYILDFTEENWSESLPYLYGIDLFNNSYWWEAHESWEQVWLAAGRGTLIGQFVQGLIQISAAQLKRFSQEEQGAQFLTTSGIEKISLAKGVFLGIEVASFIAEINRCHCQKRNEYPLIRLAQGMVKNGL